MSGSVQGGEELEYPAKNQAMWAQFLQMSSRGSVNVLGGISYGGGR